jgi:glucose/arabinose dehydrogenase
MKKTALCVLIMVLATSLAAAQKPSATKTPAPEQTEKQPTPKAERTEPRIPEPPPQPVNVKIEFTVTDQIGPGQPAKKVVSMIAGDRQPASIRSTANIRVTEESAAGVPPQWHYEEVRINVDARPALLKDGKISLSFGLEYLPTNAPAPSGGNAQRPSSRLSSLNERMGVIVESGKPLVVSQAADPASDRRITVELLATILK